MDLGLHDQVIRAEFARDLFRFLRRGRDPAGWRRSAEFLQQLLRLVFVNIHRGGALDRRAISSRNAGQQRIFPPSIRTSRRPHRTRLDIFACRRRSPRTNNLSHRKFDMKTKLLIAPLLILCFSATALRADTPEQEKDFTARYKAAYESKDTAALYSFLYTEGANPMALGFYKMMMTNGAGEKISKIELIDLTPEETKEAEGVQDG